MDKFIVLTSTQQKNEKIIINIHHIVSIMKNGTSMNGGSIIKLSTTQHFYVEESMMEIAKAIKG